MADRFLVTSALPYANGAIHFGHIVGAYLPADIFVRYQRMVGNDVLYVCGTDEHGVAITINAEKAGLSPREFVDRHHATIKAIFDRVDIRFDHFSRTTRPLHYGVSQEFFRVLHKKGHVREAREMQLFCPTDRRFLADRYVEGQCPKCGAQGARGDECPKCGSWLDPKTLASPRCKICGSAPEMRESTQWYLRLQDFQPKLEAWIGSQVKWKPNVRRFIQGIFDEGLRERAITRDLEWGVPVPLPNAPGKVLYVWFDAPIGYVSATIEWARERGEPERWRDYWLDPRTQLVHFIGKDNIPFHTLVFPAMLMGMAPETPYVLPHDVPANEFFNLEGRKFNKSEGWDIDLEGFFERYPVDSLRYYLAATAPETADSEFTWKGFQARHNSELADTLGNLASRVVSFVHAHFDGRCPKPGALGPREEALLGACDRAPEAVGSLLGSYQVRAAAEAWMNLARRTNKYLEEAQPWSKRKTELEACATSLFVALQALERLAILGAPFVPASAGRLHRMLGATDEVTSRPFTGPARVAPGTPLGRSEVLFPKIDDDRIEREISSLRERAARSQASGGPSESVPKRDAPRKRMEAHTMEPSQAPIPMKPAEEMPLPVGALPPLKPTIDYELFAQLDIRVGKITRAEAVPKSKNLLKLTVDIGLEERQVLAGIAAFYGPEPLIGRLVVVLANLKSKKLMGLESQGMVLAAHLGEAPVLLMPETEATVGGIVK